MAAGAAPLLPSEIEELHAYGITRIYSPDDGRTMGLEGMIEDVVRKCGLPLTPSRGGGTAASNGNEKFALGEWRDIKKIAQSITQAENGDPIDIFENAVLVDKKNNAASRSSLVRDYLVADPYYYKNLKDFAAKQKSNPTVAERILWERLRGRKEGFKFRRQHIIDKYIADLVCLQKGVIIEIDGNIHQLPEVIENDEVRTSRLKDLGFDVLRFSNQEILTNPDQVCENIFNLLEKKKEFISPHTDEQKIKSNIGKLPHSSSPGGGREEAPILGITGTGGAGKSSVTDEIVRRFLNFYTIKLLRLFRLILPGKKQAALY